MTRILLLLLLVGCVPPPDRELVMDTDDCLKDDKRAIMICPKYGHCFIECREKIDD